MKRTHRSTRSLPNDPAKTPEAGSPSSIRPASKESRTRSPIETQALCESMILEDSVRLDRRIEEKYKELAELLPEIVFEIDTDGHFVFINQSGLEALGHTWDELAVEVNLLDVVTRDGRDRLLRHINAVAKGESLGGAEYTLRRDDGTVFPILMYCSPIVREDRVVGIVGVAIDITDISRTQERLWIKDSAVACSMSGIVMADLNANVTYVNPAFLNLWHCTDRKEVRGRTLGELWLEKDRFGSILETLRERGSWQGEVVALRKDGTSFEARLSGTLVTDSSGKPVCLMCSVLDVTEQKQTEKDLRASEERFRTVFESARDCISLKNRTLRYTLVNPAMERLLGIPASEILGRRADDIFGPEAGKRIREVDLRALAGQSVEEERTKAVRGEQLTFHDITVPLRNAEGAITGICTISRNITDRRKTQPVRCVEIRDYPSHAMQATLERALHAADKDGIVLLRGESGSGKDFLAHWIHNHSRRASGPFFAINCAAVPQELAESELFGHEAGAFTGAKGRKRGLLELAEGGTLLLNEIGELALPLQSKLLTFLDERSFFRVGGEKTIHVNARLIAATHRDLEKEVSAGRFLPAFFYRLNVFTVHVPCLRERTEDIPVLVEEVLSALAIEMQLTEIPQIDYPALTALKRYPWPGNVREFRNVLERALMLWDKGDFKLAVPDPAGSGDAPAGRVHLPLDRSLHEVTDDMTRNLCVEALHLSRGNKQKAARMLRISRNSLYRYMKRFGLEFGKGTLF